MPENTTAKVLRIVGYGIVIIGVIGGIILGCQGEMWIAYGVGTAFGSLVTGLLLVGLGEAIALLERNVTDQAAILRLLNAREVSDLSAKGKRRSRADMKPDGLNLMNRCVEEQDGSEPVPDEAFRCVNCGSSINAYPCPVCASKGLR